MPAEFDLAEVLGVEVRYPADDDLERLAALVATPARGSAQSPLTRAGWLPGYLITRNVARTVVPVPGVASRR